MRYVSFPYLSYLFILASAVPVHAYQDADWTMVVYMEATDAMHEVAWHNMNQLMDYSSESSVNILVQLHYTDNYSWRYRVTPHSIVQLERVTLDDNVANNIIDTMKWAATYSAENYLLILWDHGFGILDPYFNEETQKWELAHGQLAQECSIATSVSSPESGQSAEQDADDAEHSRHRGMLIRADNKTVLTNPELVRACKTIHDDVLGGSFVLGLDLCMGAMLEHAYQLAPYVSYMTGAQACEVQDGYDYKALAQAFEGNSQVTPQEVVKTIVKTFGVYCKEHEAVGNYAHAAIDISQAEEVKKELDIVAALLLAGIKQHGKPFVQLISDARAACAHFCYVANYADLHQVYQQLRKKVDDFVKKNGETRLLKELNNALYIGQKTIESAVVANVAGRGLEDVHGLSIYFPLDVVDESYVQTKFGQNSVWLILLRELVKARGKLQSQSVDTPAEE